MTTEIPLDQEALDEAHAAFWFKGQQDCVASAIRAYLAHEAGKTEKLAARVREIADDFQPSNFSEAGTALAEMRCALLEAANETEVFQARVRKWLLACFGETISADRMERSHRFFEEATETVQSAGMPREDAHRLVDYTYDRPVGELFQEVGGAMVTLAALCQAWTGLDMDAAAETELARIWTKVDKIRAKQAAKPHGSPLPVVDPRFTPGWPQGVTRGELSDLQYGRAESGSVVANEAEGS